LGGKGIRFLKAPSRRFLEILSADYHPSTPPAPPELEPGAVAEEEMTPAKELLM